MRFFSLELHLVYGELWIKHVSTFSPTFDLWLYILLQPVQLRSSLPLVKSIRFSKFNPNCQFGLCSHRLSSLMLPVEETRSKLQLSFARKGLVLTKVCSNGARFCDQILLSYPTGEMKNFVTGIYFMCPTCREIVKNREMDIWPSLISSRRTLKHL